MNFIDLFAGAGGLSEGFIRAGFKPIAHVEMDKAACFTLKTRMVYHHLKANGSFKKYVDYLKGEINRDTLYKYVPEDVLNSVINLPISDNTNLEIHNKIEKIQGNRPVDLIIGGPPCQAYSIAGRSRSSNGMRGDERNYLYVQYGKFLAKYNPKMFVFENVLGLKSAGKGVYLENMRKLFSKKGYEIKLFTLEAINFGVLQNRKRIIILGWNRELGIKIPDLEAIRYENKSTVSKLLEDLPQIEAGGGLDKFASYSTITNDYLKNSGIRNGIDVLTQHVSRPHCIQDKEIYSIAVTKWNEEKKRLSYTDLPERLQTHSNKSSHLDRFKVVANDLAYSHTVVAHIAKDGHYYIHPDLSQNRSISIREAARLQSFPDDFYFEGVREGLNRTPAFRQIGNAVPPLMADVIARYIKKFFS